MKIAIQYLSDIQGNTHAVQMPLSEWEKVLGKIKKYEQTLKIKSELQEAFDQVSKMKKTKAQKQSFKDFLNEF